MIGTTVALPTGAQLPHLGLGVFRAQAGESARRAVLDALEVGYRHVDTAAAYRNEQDIGEAIRASGIPRSEIFVTTNLLRTAVRNRLNAERIVMRGLVFGDPADW